MVRNSIPDAAGGGGIEATISLYVNGTFAQKLTLSSQHSWLYGTTDDPEALTNTPQARRPPAVRRVARAAVAVLPGRHEVPAAARRRRHRVVLHHRPDRPGAGRAGGRASRPAAPRSRSTARCRTTGIDDTAAIQRAVTDDQNGVISCVWIPAGQWRQEKKILTDDPLNRGQYNQVGHQQRRRSAVRACGTPSCTR